MGLFDKFKGKQNKESKNEQAVAPQVTTHVENWDFYFTNVDDKPGSIYLDLGLEKAAPIKSKPNLLWVSVQMNDPREDGMSSSEESEKLYIIEDDLIDTIHKSLDTIYAGRLTSDGYRDFYFYIKDTGTYEKVINKVMSNHTDYKFSCGVKPDAEWSTYFDFLYPEPAQMQMIQNRRVVQQLQEHGDPLTKEREVNHWLYFKTEKDREDFLQKIEGNGFTVESKEEIKDTQRNPFSLRVSRVDFVDWNSVNDYVLYLWEQANEVGGEYDGWETSVEKE